MSGYTPNKWVDREGTTRYFETVDDDGALIFTPDYTRVTEMGTPVNADNMNHIEEGIGAVSFSKYNSMTTYAKEDLITTIVDNELKVYKSLQDNNNGNPLTDTNYWEEVEFAGGGGISLPLGYSSYMGATLEALPGWLAATGVFVSGAIYTTFYNDAVNKIGEPFGAGNIVEHTSNYTDYDLVINQENATFRLPLKNGTETLPTENFISFGLSNIPTAGYTYTAPANGYIAISCYNHNSNVNLRVIVNGTYKWYSGGIADANPLRPCCNLFVNKGDTVVVQAENGDIANVNYAGFFYAKGEGTLYFYVGNTVANRSELNVGEVLNELNNVQADLDNFKTDNVYITDHYVNGTSGYDIYSNGSCVQWGRGSGDNFGITFLLPMANTDYAYQATGTSSGNTASGHNYLYDRTTTGMRCNGYGDTCWWIKGKMA